MNIKITGRHINLSADQKEYAEKKIKRLEKYFNQIIDAHIIMHVEKLDHVSEVIINGDGIQFHGREKSTDFMSAIDLLFEKMERQIKKYKEKHQMHKGPDKGDGAFLDFTSDQGFSVRMNQVSNKPIDKVEAYLQMKIDRNEFILFKKGIQKVDSDLDYSNRNYAIIYRNGENYKMIEIPFEKIMENELKQDTFIEYDLDVIEDSNTSPVIEFKKNSQCGINEFSIEDALNEINAQGFAYLPFFNVESQSLNILYKNGKSYEVMVPAF